MDASSGSPPAVYGDRHAAVYDRIYGDRFAPEAAVDALARFGADGGVLELGVGTGRLAIPLARRGITVDGIEGSPAMAARRREQPGGDQVGVLLADLADFSLERTDDAVAVCAVSTLFMLRHAAQRTCLAAAARHVRPGGLVLIEAFQPDGSRFDDAGNRIEHRDSNAGGHTVHSHHDPQEHTISITHTLTSAEGDEDQEADEVMLSYRSVEQLDEMASAAGLELAFRWHDWTAAPFSRDSKDPISGYRRAVPVDR